MADQNLEKLLRLTYLKMIENSIGSKIFNSAFVKDKTTGKVFDVLNDGEYSCAFFVSGILSLVGLIDRPHSTVKTVSEVLARSERWERVEGLTPVAGDVVVWEEAVFEDGSKNDHIGFCLDEKTAVSTNYKEKKVAKHSIDFDGTRKFQEVFRPNI